ncbi:MAG: ISAs1 family transposase [Planctomycetaceae bacterium]|nr:ISAs1 family transposase [Planctomycetaceae bacterium]
MDEGREYVRGLKRCLEGLDDPRVVPRCDHLLLDIVAITLLAVMCGAEDSPNVEQFAESREDFLKTSLELPNGIPSHDTFRRVFGQHDRGQFAAGLFLCTQALHEATGGKVISIDGKALRRTFSKRGGLRMLHLSPHYPRHTFKQALALLRGRPSQYHPSRPTQPPHSHSTPTDPTVKEDELRARGHLSLQGSLYADCCSLHIAAVDPLSRQSVQAIPFVDRDVIVERHRDLLHRISGTNTDWIDRLSGRHGAQHTTKLVHWPLNGVSVLSGLIDDQGKHTDGADQQGEVVQGEPRNQRVERDQR